MCWASSHRRLVMPVATKLNVMVKCYGSSLLNLIDMLRVLKLDVMVGRWDGSVGCLDNYV